MRPCRQPPVRVYVAPRCVPPRSPQHLPSRSSPRPLALQEDAKGYRAEIVIGDGGDRPLCTRQRASAEADCRSLGEAVAVAITVAIDLEATGVVALAVGAGCSSGTLSAGESAAARATVTNDRKKCPELLGERIQGQSPADSDADGCIDSRK